MSMAVAAVGYAPVTSSGGVSNTQQSEKGTVASSGGVLSASKSNPINFSQQSEESQESSKAAKALKIAKERLGERLDVEVKDGMLIISANKVPRGFWSQLFNDVDMDRRLDTIKNKLGIKDKVISEANENLRANISLYYTPNLDEGILTGAIKIPIDEIGKAQTFWDALWGTFSDLNNAQ